MCKGWYGKIKMIQNANVVPALHMIVEFSPRVGNDSEKNAMNAISRIYALTDVWLAAVKTALPGKITRQLN